MGKDNKEKDDERAQSFTQNLGKSFNLPAT